MRPRAVTVWAFLLTLASAASAASAQQIDDGPTPTVDIDFQTSTDTIDATWTGQSVDAAGFEWAIGTTPGGQDVQAFTNVGMLTAASKSGLALTPGSIYYATVRGVYMGFPFELRSDGVTVFKDPTANGGTATSLTGTAPFTVTFGLQMQGVTFYEWDFDQPPGSDGQISSPEFTGTASGNAQFTYQTPGSYEATWRITHAGGDSSVNWFTITVNPSPQAPSVGITAVPPTGPAPLAVTFTALATTKDGSVAAVLWDFEGDGLIDASSDSSLSITHTFGAIGTFKTRVTVVDGAGNQASAGQDIIVTDPGTFDPPGITVASFPPSAPSGVPVVLDLDLNPGTVGTLTSVEIDFDGDGSVDRMRTTGLGPPYPRRISETFQYDAPGTKSVVITVRDSEGYSVTTGRAGLSHTVLHDPANLRCWITQPVNGARVWGNHLSVFAQAVPEAEVTEVVFEYRTAAPPGPWIPIGTAPASAEGVFAVFWDVTGLTQGINYDLHAVAKFGGPTADSESIQLITVQVQEGAPGTPVPPYYEEFSGSPFTKLQIVTVNPNSLTIGSILNSMSVQVPAGALLSYDQMRLERRAEALQTVSARLQGLKIVHQRKLSFGANPQQQTTTLNKPSKVTMYVGSSGPILPDGTDLTKATLKLYRYEPARNRWEPLLNTSFNPAKIIVQAQTAAGGNLAVAVDEPTGGGESSGSCGLGVEGVLVLFFLRRRRR